MTIPRNGQTVHCYDKLSLENGTELFNARRDSVGAIGHIVDNCEQGFRCKGFDECIKKTSKGQRAKLTISPEPMGFGAEGCGVGNSANVPPNSTLIYEVEVDSFRFGQ